MLPGILEFGQSDLEAMKFKGLEFLKMSENPGINLEFCPNYFLKMNQCILTWKNVIPPGKSPGKSLEYLWKMLVGTLSMMQLYILTSCSNPQISHAEG